MITPPDNINKILITRLRFIGDVVLTLPVIKALRLQYPDSRLYYLAEKSSGEILTGHPDLEELICLDRQRIDTQNWYHKPFEHIKFLNSLRSYRFDLVIDLFCNPRSAFLTFYTGAGIRIGFDVRGRGVVYNVKIERGSSLKSIDAYLDAVRTIGIEVTDDQPRLHLSDDERTLAGAWLREHGHAEEKKLVCICPGASWPAKTWGADTFAALGDRLVDSTGADIFLIQGPGQEQLVLQVADRMQHPPVIADLLPIRLVAALMEQSDVVISNDSGPMHIGAAVGTATVGIFGPSDPDIWFPYDATAGCYAISPDVSFCCGRDFCTEDTPCINTISVDSVYEAVLRAMDVAHV